MKSVLDACLCLTSKDRLLYNILVEHKKVRLGVPVPDKSDTRLDNKKNPELGLIKTSCVDLKVFLYSL